MQKTLLAITAEIEKEFDEKFVDTDGTVEWEASYVRDFIRAALLKVATETVEAVMPEQVVLDAVYESAEFQSTQDEAHGWNAARNKVQDNFKTFINQ